MWVAVPRSYDFCFHYTSPVYPAHRRKTTKRILIPTILAVLLLVGAGFFTSNVPRMKATGTVRADEAALCSLATVAGDYGFTLTGTLLFPTGPVPFAAIGTAMLTAQGNGSGTEARNVGGSFANETLTATFTVNPDCTGAATIMAFESGQLVRTAVVSAVWDDNSNEIREIAQSVTLPDGTRIPAVLTVEARKISPNSGE